MAAIYRRVFAFRLSPESPDRVRSFVEQPITSSLVKLTIVFVTISRDASDIRGKRMLGRDPALVHRASLSAKSGETIDSNLEMAMLGSKLNIGELDWLRLR